MLGENICWAEILKKRANKCENLGKYCVFGLIILKIQRTARHMTFEVCFHFAKRDGFKWKILSMELQSDIPNIVGNAGLHLYV